MRKLASSLYGRIFLWSIGVLALAMFVLVNTSPVFLLAGDGGPIDRMNHLLFRQARDELRRGGVDALRTYLSSLETQMPASYFLLDAQGRDLVTGEDKSALVQHAQSRWQRTGGRITQVLSRDGFQFLLLVQPAGGLGDRRPYALLIAAMLALMSWLFASRLARPVRGLAQTMDRFGAGDMSARSTLRRSDEIGGLARSFNQMAERMEALMTAERRLLQDVSHELQSPLARLKVAARLAETAADRGAALARVQKEVDRMAALISGLLDVTRAEGDPGGRAREPVRLADLVRTVADDAQWETGDRTFIRLSLDAATVTGDEELLRRSIENVVRNAVRFTPEGSPVDVQLRRGDTCAVLTVRDMGPGVPEDAVDKIFQPFYRVNDSDGTGLGLALARRAVRVHGGTIRAELARPGLRVTIELPCNASQ